MINLFASGLLPLMFQDTPPTHTHIQTLTHISPLTSFFCRVHRHSLSPHASMLREWVRERKREGGGWRKESDAFSSRYTHTNAHTLKKKKPGIDIYAGKSRVLKANPMLVLLKNQWICSVLLTISNYLPVKAKVNKFPHIQQGYITNRTPTSSDGK